jgi:tRNA-binding protein
VLIQVDEQAPQFVDVGGIIRKRTAEALQSANQAAHAQRRPSVRGGGNQMTDHPKQTFKQPGSATFEDFQRIDMRVARITAVEPFPAARKPAYRLTLDFGPMGTRRSSAQLPPTYPDPGQLVGRLVVAVVNFAPRNIAGFQSEVLVLGALPGSGLIPLLGVDEGAAPGDQIG